MDYRTFLNEVATWIEQCNQMAVQQGMESYDFWKWVSESIGQLSQRYGNNKLVNKQLVMLFLWLEDVYAEAKSKTL